ncbi:unnamed protein product, partial [Ectocarpus sp. 12 AP-2014]
HDVPPGTLGHAAGEPVDRFPRTPPAVVGGPRRPCRCAPARTMRRRRLRVTGAPGVRKQRQGVGQQGRRSQLIIRAGAAAAVAAATAAVVVQPRRKDFHPEDAH